MAFGKRINFQKQKRYEQKELGELLGFLGKTSDVRVAQYETEARTPKLIWSRNGTDLRYKHQSYQCSKH